MEAKKAPVESVPSVIETFDTLMALKKVIQCMAITNPESNKINKVFLGIRRFIFLKSINSQTKSTANPIRNQTNGKASKLMSAPSMAVNPHINTMR
jgi:hypothetical protein